MAQQNVVKPEQEALGAAMNKTELFFENNGKKVVYVLLALLVLAALVYGYKSLIADPRVERAAAMISEAQNRFESEPADYELALEGDENGAGFLDVVGQYGSTPSGNLAAHYAGLCYLHLGDLENAAKYLSKFSTVKGLPGSLINAQNYGLQGDIAVEQDDYAAALKYYDKAIKAAKNNFTAPMYLRKAGLAARAKGDAALAAKYFRQLVDYYPATQEGREAEKLLGTNE